MASHHPAKFGGQRHCSSGDAFNLSHDLARPRDPSFVATGVVLMEMFLVCRVTSEDHVNMESFDFTASSLSRIVSILASLETLL